MRWLMMGMLMFVLSPTDLDSFTAGKAILTTSKTDVPGAVAGKNVPNVVKTPGGAIVVSPVGSIYVKPKRGK